jgi:hypothetical protein
MHGELRGRGDQIWGTPISVCRKVGRASLRWRGPRLGFQAVVTDLALREFHILTELGLVSVVKVHADPLLDGGRGRRVWSYPKTRWVVTKVVEPTS